jgi:glycosyltransferase involved in cell wall biosynthesis
MNDDVSVLVAPDAGSMAEGMRRLIGSAQVRERIGSAGQTYVEREFSEQRFRQRLSDFYNTLSDLDRSGSKEGHRPNAA